MLNTSATDTSPTNEESNPSLGSGDSIIISGPTRTLPDRLNELLMSDTSSCCRSDVRLKGPDLGHMTALTPKQTAKRQFGKEKS